MTATPQRAKGPSEQPALTDRSAKQLQRTRGPGRLQASDFTVKSNLPDELPILDAELRAIEMMLGAELKSLVGRDVEK
jgi:hypothetical protein